MTEKRSKCWGKPTSGMKGYVIPNVRYTAVCSAKKIENWPHGKCA